MWFDATGKRLPAPLFPGFDTLATLEHIGQTGYDYTWFILNRRIIAKEFALSGSEQNPDITGQERAGHGALSGCCRSARTDPEVHGPWAGFRRASARSRISWPG